MHKPQQIINYFCVVGLGSRLVPLNQENQKQKSLTSLEVQYGQVTEDIHIRDNEKWINLSKDVWLRAIYDQKDRVPITNLQMLELKYEDDSLKIPLQLDYQPCVVKKRFDSTISQFKGITNGHSLYAGNFDLSPLLAHPTKRGYQLVLCYQIQTQINFTMPICDLQLINADRIDKKKKTNHPHSEMRLIIPKDYHALEFGFGDNDRNKYIVYKQKQSPFKVAYMPKCIDRYPIEDINDIPMIPMFCFPQGIYLNKGNEDPMSLGQCVFNFILTSETGQRTYCTCLQFYELFPNDMLDQLGHIQQDTSYISHPKALCLLSPYNYSDQMKELVKYIYRSSLSKNNIPLEQTISNIVNKIRFPPSYYDYENIALKYVLPSQDIYFYANYKYPQQSVEPLNCLLHLLDTSRIILLITAILLEKKIHLISNNISVPGLIIEAFLQLLFPFEFTSILIPVLPDSLRSYIEAPVPFIIGYSQKNVVDQNQHTQSDSIYVYLDTNFVMNIETIPLLPEKSLKVLKQRLKGLSHFHSDSRAKSYLKRVGQAYQMYMHDSDYDPEETIDYQILRNAFLELNASLLKGYKKFLNPVINKDQIGDFTVQFRVQDYLTYHGSDTGFLQQFVETRLFQYFIQERTRLSPNEPYYHFFDKCIDNKNKELIPIEVPKKMYLVNVDEAPHQKVYQYDRFPKLSQELYTKSDHIDLDDGKHDQCDELIPTNGNMWAKFILEHIYKLWFQLFIIKTRNSTDNEAFRKLTHYAIYIIDYMRMQNLQINEKIFRYALEACGYFQLDEQALQLVRMMKELKVETSPATHGVYFQAVAKAVNSKGVQLQQQQSVDEHSLQMEQCQLNNQFTNAIIKLSDQCPKCKRILQFEEILDGFHKSVYDNQIQCIKHNQLHGCGNCFIPKMQITYYQDENPVDSEIQELYNPLQLQKDLDNLMKSKGETYILSDLFEKQYRNCYINLIAYIKLVKLPYFFMIPKINEKYYVEYIANLMSQIKNEYNQKSKKSLMKIISQEIDHYKLKFEQIKVKDQDSSSGSLNGSTRQEHKQINYGCKMTQKVFQKYIKELSENATIGKQSKPASSKNSQHQFQSLQQFDENRQESPSKLQQ